MIDFRFSNKSKKNCRLWEFAQSGKVCQIKLTKSDNHFH